MSKQIAIREYQPKHHLEVCKIFGYCIREPFWNGEAFKVCFKSLRVQFNLAAFWFCGFAMWHSYFHGFVMLAVGVCFHAACIYCLYDEYARTHLATDMSDELLSFWTSPPNVFLVATSSEKVVGFISYRQINPTTVEMHRLNVDLAFRGLGIGSLLVQALKKTAKQKGYQVMYLETTSSQKNAIKLYGKTFQYLRDIEFDHPFYKYVSGLNYVAYISRL